MVHQEFCCGRDAHSLRGCIGVFVSGMGREVAWRGQENGRLERKVRRAEGVEPGVRQL